MTVTGNKKESPISIRQCLLIQLFLAYLDNTEAHAAERTGRDTEHRGGFRGRYSIKALGERRRRLLLRMLRWGLVRITLRGSCPRSCPSLPRARSYSA